MGSNFGVTNTGAAYASNLVVGPSNGYHATADSSGFKIYNNTTQLSNFGTDITLGQTSGTNRNVFIDADSGVSIRKGTTVLANYGDIITFNHGTSGNAALTLDSTNGLKMFKLDGTTLAAQLNANGLTVNVGYIGGWELSSDKLVGNSYSIMQNETGTIKNTTYLYSGTTSSEDIIKQDSSNTYIIKPGTNAAICVDFSTRPVHENRLGYYSNNLYINIGVKITGFVGNATIKYTYEYRDYDNKTISVTTAKHVNITETTTIYQPISILPHGEVLLNADIQVVYETPYTINGSGGKISTLCSIRDYGNTSTIFFYAKPINAYYLDSFSAMSIQRIYNNDASTQEETYRLEQSGYIYSKGGLRTSGDIVFNDNISMIELSKRNAVQTATKAVAITSSNTIDNTPAIGAQLTLSPGTYLLWGRFVFSTASSGTSRNNQIAFYTGADPTNDTIINHSMQRVYAAARNWGSLTTTCIVSPTTTTTYTVGGTSSLPGPDGGDSAIKAVRLL